MSAPASVEAAPHALPLPPIRLRTVLLLGVLVAAALWAHPRARAAWNVHSAGAAVANYGLCMVGPTGPSLLRDNPAEFRTLVRRRLIAARADEQPFEGCAKFALEVTDSVDIERAHRHAAAAYLEYGAIDPGTPAARRAPTLDQLRVSTKPVAELAQEAWPFVRSGYTVLVRPSMTAKEAVHPVELPRAGVGRGLPAWHAWYRPVVRQGKRLFVAIGAGANLSVLSSTDGGTVWSVAPVSAGRAFAERCGSPERWFAFSLNGAANTVLVTSHGAGVASEPVPLARADAELFATSCDDTTLVAALKAKGRRDVVLKLCSHGAGCRPLELPRFGSSELVPRYPLDVARVKGAIVLATNMNGILRVTSSRDDGRSWTPYNVALDGVRAGKRGGGGQRVHLLPLDDRVMLYTGAGEPSTEYPVLFSDDFGASWRAR
ncbi:MAG: hypothetical protein KF718_12230 [Polyangiaceae bacterium]|nr:hypothetical protein [Polyangiaceae bacterium]